MGNSNTTYDGTVNIVEVSEPKVKTRFKIITTFSFIFGLFLITFSALGFFEVLFDVNFLKPGLVALLYTIIGGVFGLIFLGMFLWYVFGRDRSSIAYYQQFDFYVIVMLFFGIFFVNLVCLWRFFHDYCQVTLNVSMFDCPVPLFNDPGEFTNFLSYNAIMELNALFFVVLVFFTYVLATTQWTPVEKLETSTAVARPSSSQSTVTHSVLYQSAFFYFGIALVLALLVYAGLAFAEVLFDVNYLSPWPLALTFTIIIGFLFVLSNFSMFWYSSGQREKPTILSPEMTTYDTQYSEISCQIGLWLVSFFFIYMIALWVFYANTCTGSGATNPDCTNPINVCPDFTCEDFWNFEFVNGLAAFYLPYMFALVVTFLIVAFSEPQGHVRRSLLFPFQSTTAKSELKSHSTNRHYAFEK